MQDIARRLQSGAAALRDKVAHAVKHRPSAKEIAHAASRSVPGAAFVTARAGGAAFNVFHFLTNTSTDPNAAKNSLAMTLAFFMSLGTGGIMFFTRFWNLYREEVISPDTRTISEANPLTEAEKNALRRNLVNQPELIDVLMTPDEIMAEDDLESQIPQQPTFWHPGVKTTRAKRVGYVASHISNYIAIVSNGITSVVNANALILLIKYLGHLDFDDQCTENNATPAQLTFAWLATALLVYGYTKSFLRYNLPALKEYYQDLYIREGYREIGKKDWGEILLGTFLNSLTTFYTKFHFCNIVEKEMLCHLTPVAFPLQLAQLVAYFFAINNFFAHGAMTAGAVYHRQTTLKQMQLASLSQSAADKIISQEADVLPFQPGMQDLPLKLCILLNSANMGFMNTYNSVVTLPKNTGGVDAALHPVTILTGCGLGLVSFFNEGKLNIEACRREQLARVEDKRAEQQQAETDFDAAPAALYTRL